MTARDHPDSNWLRVDDEVRDTVYTELEELEQVIYSEFNGVVGSEEAAENAIDHFAEIFRHEGEVAGDQIESYKTIETLSY